MAEEPVTVQEDFDEFQDASESNNTPQIIQEESQVSSEVIKDWDFKKNSEPVGFVQSSLNLAEEDNESSKQDQEDFGDWTEAQEGTLEDERPSDLAKPTIGNNLLELDESETSFAAEPQVIVSQLPARPKVELNENNLLSGFMFEFGLNQSNPVIEA